MHSLPYTHTLTISVHPYPHDSIHTYPHEVGQVLSGVSVEVGIGGGDRDEVLVPRDSRLLLTLLETV